MMIIIQVGNDIALLSTSFLCFLHDALPFFSLTDEGTVVISKLSRYLSVTAAQEADEEKETRKEANLRIKVGISGLKSFPSVFLLVCIHF